jgi:hypothetical protein
MVDITSANMKRIIQHFNDGTIKTAAPKPIIDDIETKKSKAESASILSWFFLNNFV